MEATKKVNLKLVSNKKSSVNEKAKTNSVSSGDDGSVRFNSQVLKLIDKETVCTNSHNNTNVCTLIFEDDNKDTKTIQLKDDVMHIAKDRKAAICFMDNKPVAYLASKNDAVNQTSKLETDYPNKILYCLGALALLWPAMNVVLYFSGILISLFSKDEYFEKGKIVKINTMLKVSLACFVISVLGMLPLVNDYFLNSLFNIGIFCMSSLISAGIFCYFKYQIDKKIHFGLVEMFKIAKGQLEKLRSQL